MDPSTSTTVDGEPSSGSFARSGGLREGAQSMWQELSGIAHDRLLLAALETRLAGESLVAMIVAGVMAAVLLVAAWLGVMIAAILALVGTGVTAGLAVMIGVTANVLVALLLYGVIRRKSRNLQWAASLRSLRSPPAVERDKESRHVTPD
jgi:hypothetical protein